MAEIAEVTGADVTQLADAIGHDVRIGRRFLGAGIGFGALAATFTSSAVARSVTMKGVPFATAGAYTSRRTDAASTASSPVVERAKRDETPVPSATPSPVVERAKRDETAGGRGRGGYGRFVSLGSLNDRGG
jgi:hypothetical protein